VSVLLLMLMLGSTVAARAAAALTGAGLDTRSTLVPLLLLCGVAVYGPHLLLQVLLYLLLQLLAAVLLLLTYIAATT
jgi:hypothetical protein